MKNYELILKKYDIKAIFTVNSKIKKSNSDTFKVVNFSIPAFYSKLCGVKTCPQAGNCAKGCYARSGMFNWDNVRQNQDKKLQLTLNSNDFIFAASHEINKLKNGKKRKRLFVRIHDSGDYYSAEYVKSWLEIMKKHQDVTFYSYSKSLTLVKPLELLSNFVLIKSFGGKQDHLIDKAKDRHAVVFATELELEKSGYINANDNDLIACLNSNLKIGLVYHGVKAFKNTSWLVAAPSNWAA